MTPRDNVCNVCHQHHDNSMTPEIAHEIVARHVISNAFWADMWQDYPGISKSDWAAINRLIDALTPLPTRAEYAAAYTYLAARADHT